MGGRWWREPCKIPSEPQEFLDFRLQLMCKESYVARFSDGEKEKEEREKQVVVLLIDAFIG